MIRIFLRLFVQGFRDLSLNPWAQVFTFAAVTLVAFLSGLFLMALTTLNYQLSSVRGETAFQVYWRQGMAISEIQEQWKLIPNLPGFSNIVTYTPEEALQELANRLGRMVGSRVTPFPSGVEEEPLPATALISFLPQSNDIDSWISETKSYLGNLPGVNRVVATPLRDELGQAWRSASKYIMWPSIAFLTFILALVVGNTIRLSLLERSHEIEILQMVGSYNWYIRLPLVVGGAIQGFAGGFFALVLLKFIHMQIQDVLNFPPLLMEIQFLPFTLCLALVLVPTLMGMIASWLAVRS